MPGFTLALPDGLTTLPDILIIQSYTGVPGPHLYRSRGIFIRTNFDEKNNCVILEVRDEGSGIPRENIKSIFDPFYTTKRNSGGTGLGLSISLTIVEEHGGSLDYSSDTGKGTTATIILPLNNRVQKSRHG